MAGVQPCPPNFKPRKSNRISLDEFEQIESLLKMQSQNSDDGNDWMEALREQGVLCDGDFGDEEDNGVLLDDQLHVRLNTSEEEALANQGVLFSTDDLTTDDQKELPRKHSNLPASRQFNGMHTTDKVEDSGGLDEFLQHTPSPYSLDQEEEPELSYLDDNDYERQGSSLSDHTDNRLGYQNSENISEYSNEKCDRESDNPEHYLILNHHNTLARTIHAGVSPHPDSFTRDSDPIPYSRNQSIRSSLRSLHTEESGSIALDIFLDPELERTIQEVASQVESFASPRPSSTDGRLCFASENDMDTTGQVTSYMTEEVDNFEVNNSYNRQMITNRYKEESAVESYESDTGAVSESANLNLGNFVPNAVLRNRPPKPSAIKLSAKAMQQDEAIGHVNGEVDDVKNGPRYETDSHLEEASLASSSVCHQITSHKTNKPRMGSQSNFSIDSDLPPDELIDQLKHEKSTRKQNDELVDRLQQDYDDLLQKYALAEVTIDQLRLGAKVNLYSDPPPGVQGSDGRDTPRANHPQTIHLPQPQRATVVSTTTSHQKSGNSTMTSPKQTPEKNQSHGKTRESGTGTSYSTPEDAVGKAVAASYSAHEDTLPFPEFTGSEGIAIGLQFQTKGLEEQVQVFENQLAADELQPAEQDQINCKLRADHEALEQDYMQAREEYQARRRRDGNLSTLNVTFDADREVEGGIFQLGMKLDDINEIVEKNLRNQRPETPPTRRDFFPEHSIEDEIERRRVDMDRHYDSLMDRYDQLKNSTYYPNRDQEIEDLVMALENLHHQDPSRYPLKQAPLKSSTLPGQFLSTSQSAVSVSPSSPGTQSKGDISFASTPGKTPETSNISPQKGTSSSKIPYWNSSLNHEGSISESTTSPDTVRRNPVKEFHRNGSSSKSATNYVPRKESQDSQGVGSRQKSPELDRDSGFMGSESSRQSQLTNHSGSGVEKVMLNGPGKITSTGIHQVDDESVLPVRSKKLSFQRQPSYDSYDGPISLHFDSDAEEQSVSQSEQTTVRCQPSKQDHRKTPLTNGNSHPVPNQFQQQFHQKQTHPSAANFQDYLTPQAADCLPPQQKSLSAPYGSRNRSKTLGGSRLPEKPKARLHKDVDPRSERSHTIQNGYHKESMYPSRFLKPDTEMVHEDDSISNATRGSVKSATLKALQKQIVQLKDRLAEAESARSHENGNSTKPSYHWEEFSSQKRKVASASASDTSSVKSEVLHSLQNDVRELQSRLAAGDRLPPQSGHASVGNDLRKTLRDNYIPKLPSSVDNFSRSTNPSRRRILRSGSSDASDTVVGSLTSNTRRRSPLRVNKGHTTNLTRTSNPHTIICTHCQGSGICLHNDHTLPRYENTQQTAQQTYPNNFAEANGFTQQVNTPHTNARPVQSSYLAQSPIQPGYSPQSPAPQYMSTPVAHHTPQYMGTPVAEHTPQYMGTPITQNTPQYMSTPIAQQFSSPPAQHAPQYISTPVQPTYVPSPQPDVYPQKQQMTVREYIPTPVHSLPSKTDARFYVRRQEKRGRSRTSSEEEEFYYRRTPHSKSRNHTSSSIKRGYNKKAPSSSKSDAGLEAAIRVARHLKSTSRRMLSCVEQDLSNSMSLRDILS
ncbi:uncharacterized protein LOC117107848 [Anneissia japonica]|uniref:uncharacterized protein LOC117107848 n=1 Tax=Anneissia japonica TaxID=1529436 RepID=UPI0014257026|nr:uncharacterized protein LOC117107848 [Anneissia japonica]XP_033105550.1 uncharacterized protein LOC117107848 [Anneissia japonica]XP_033105559.1 uncharacterized protein LOC117107848 [Anneissia japonica]XP_033105565.1 uncharacterized protein LOC117107848 [Anneissia japonica]XP_033105575.1 uncharacterized protein LOC117107848 [Anneissia japonica]